MRLPSSLHLKQSGEFARMRRDGRSQAGRHLVLAFRRDASVEEFQFGLITSRRLGPAVVRNRVRRQLREVIRAHRKRIQPGLKMVVIGRWSAPKASYQQIERDWLKLAKRVGILRNDEPSA